MNPTITKLALQAMLGRRRFWLLLAFPVLLVGMTVLVRVLTDSDTAGWRVLENLGYPLVLPVVAVLAGSSVLGPEIEDGSIVHLLAKPVNRHAVAVSKWLVAVGATLLAGALPVLVAGLVAGGGDLALGWGVAAAVAGTTYSALFLALSALTRHAVIVALGFVLVWEAILGPLFSGVAWLSVGQWGLRVGHEVAGQLPDPASLPWALVASLVVVLGGVWLTGDRLRSFALRGDE